jgi:hypothetical protein
VKNAKRVTLNTPFGVSQWWADLQQREVAGQRVTVLLVLGLIIVLALFLRLTGVNWDSFQHMNPDERHSTNVGATILRDNGGFLTSPIEYFDTAGSPLNPYNEPNAFPEYVWGTFPLYSTMAVADILDEAPLIDPDNGAWVDYGNLNLVGRVLSALVDIGTIVLMFLLERAAV